MKNLTLAIDDTVLDEVRQIAARRRTTVNALVRDYLTRVAAEEGRTAEARKELRELMDMGATVRCWSKSFPRSLIITRKSPHVRPDR